VAVRAFGGPAFDLRVVVLADVVHKLHPDDVTAEDQADAVREYFWGKGRWFMPVLGGGFDFAINEKILLGLDTRVWFPIWRTWTGEDLPGIEGWRFGFGLRISPRKRQAVKPAATAAETR